MYCRYTNDGTQSCNAILYRHFNYINGYCCNRGGDGPMTMYILWTIILSGIGTLLLRITPFIAIAQLQLSEKVIQWLSFIPITLFAALVVDGLIIQESGHFGFRLNWIYVFAVIPTLLATLISRSLTIAVIIGMVSVACLRLILPL